VSYTLVFLLAACGGGSSPLQSSVSPKTEIVSNAKVGDGFIYADGEWKLSGEFGNKWVARGTTETPQFMPAGYYQPLGGISNVAPWWTLTNTNEGLLMRSKAPAGDFYNGSFVNDVMKQNVYVRNSPLVDVDIDVVTFKGIKARATIGITMVFPNGQSYYLERNIIRTDTFKLCFDEKYDRCIKYITYFPPASGSIDVRSLLLQSPGMSVVDVDSLRIIGVYIGSEIYGEGEVDLLIKKYEIRQ
jgi:hypothetical protein